MIVYEDAKIECFLKDRDPRITPYFFLVKIWFFEFWKKKKRIIFNEFLLIKFCSADDR